MQIEIGSDHSIQVHDEWAGKLEEMVQHALRHHRDQLTRVVLHLSDENAHKAGDNDKRCAMEGRLRGMQPVAVTHHGDTFDKAAAGAADKLSRLLEHTLAKASAKRPPPPPAVE
ncbi:MAG: HPF/RaiA family ribosome-associated protein [Rubrivivax sp.]